MTKADLNDLLVTSPDYGEERLETLKQLFPDLFTDEGELNIAALRQLAESEDTGGREQYSFNWRGKTRAKRHAFTPSRAALTYDPERSVNPEKADGNIIIEGENLEVLKLLAAAYRGKVKCIYIDPPYNTGGDFIYPDNYTRDRKEYWEENGSYQDGIRMDTNPETSGRYHSDWLSMIYSRLLVARQLLTANGLIFSSIGNEEIHNLRKVMDEVFGEENFIAQLIWQNRKGGGNDSTHIAVEHEYVLMYAKDKSEVGELFESYDDEYLKRYSEEDQDGKFFWDTFKRKTGKQYYPITCPDGTVLEYDELGNKISWLRSEARFYQDLEDGEIKFVESNGSWSVFFKQRLPEGKKPRSLLLNEGTTSSGSSEMLKIFGKEIFENPKPKELVKKFLSFNLFQNDIVLDFFAGSGVTSHAVMETNEEDESKNLRFIIVQLPEQIEDKRLAGQNALSMGYKKISDITIERSKKVIEGYGENPQSLDTGFKVYRLTKSHFPRVEFQPDPDKSKEENIEALKKYIAEKEASFQMTFDQDKIFDEVLLKHGFTLDYTLTEQEDFEDNAVYLAEDGTRQALICLDMSLNTKTVDMFKDRTERPFICLERALDTTKKWNLKHYLGDRLKAI